MNTFARLRIPFLACLFLLAAMHAAPISAQSKKWDTTYIADDTFFVVALNIEQLLSYEKEDSELRKMVEEGIRSEMGLEISELSQIQFIMGGDENEDYERNAEELFQVKFVFSKPQKTDKLMETMFQYVEFEKAKHDGKEFFKSNGRHSPSVFWPSKQMMVVANTEHLQRIMEAELSMNEFADMLKQADGNKDLFLSFSHNKITDKMMGQLAEEMEGLPFDIQDIASEAKSGSMVVDLADDKPITGNIVAKDEEGAERLKRAVDALVALGKTGIPFALEQVAAAEEKFPNATEQLKSARQGLKMAKSALDGTTVAVRGSDVQVQVAMQGGMVDAVKLLGQFIGSELFMSANDVEFEERLIEVEDIEDMHCRE